MCDLSKGVPRSCSEEPSPGQPENPSSKLIAWLDGELPPDEAARVEQHVRACAECRSRVDAYDQVSSAFTAYCDAAVAVDASPRPIATQRAKETPPPETHQRWVPILLGAAAAVIILLLAFPRARVEPPATPPQAAAAVGSQSVFESTPPVPPQSRSAAADRAAANSAAKTVRKPHAAPPAQTPPQVPAHAPAPRPSQIRDAAWQPAEPAIEIAIPAEAMFPPGAVPEGFNFTADLSIAPDGSASRIRLQPRLSVPIGTPVNYERKPTRP
ncbi:MAG TPA: zf-HC2 domain-containing protein [Candidatus Acidoferrales bacterium]